MCNNVHYHINWRPQLILTHCVNYLALDIVNAWSFWGPLQLMISQNGVQKLNQPLHRYYCKTNTYLLTYEIVIDIPHPPSKFRSSEYIFGELCCFYWFTEWIFYLPTITSGFPPRWSAWVLIKSPTKEPLFTSAGQSKQKSFSSWKGNGKQKHSYKSMENAFKMVSLFVISHQSISLVLIGCTV